MDQLIDAIANRDVVAALSLMFEWDASRVPIVRTGLRRESDIWDFKAGLPGLRAEQDRAWADIAADLAALHNKQGGLLFFGIDDKSLQFIGTRDVLDAKRFNDKVRRYLGDKVWVEFSREFVQSDQRYLGVALIPPRGVVPLRMRADAPPNSAGKRAFSAGDFCIREGDQTRILKGRDADAYLAGHRLPTGDARYLVRDDGVRILRPDWDEFLLREELCSTVEKALQDDRTYVATLTGVGGVGKTALACWAVLRAYERHDYEYIVSVSAKDREFTDKGISPTVPTLSSFDDLLNEVLSVLGFSEYISRPIEEREKVVRELLPGASVLMFVDNLETVDDPRVIQFLETLPKPVKAITTSRVAKIRTAAYPIAVGPLTVDESVKFFDAHAIRRGKEALRRGSRPERERIVEACSRVPLVIEWLVGRSSDMAAALNLAAALSASGRHDEELLEFSFRRVHSELTPEAKNALAALALDDGPQVLEALGAATAQSIEVVDSALSELEFCSLVERVWDDRMHDFAFRVLPLTRRFAYRELQRNRGSEQAMRGRLSAWYEGADVSEDQRETMVAVRRGTRDPDAALVEAAISFRTQGKIEQADQFFRRAIDRNPRSWRAHREYAELLRDQGSVGAALEHYSIAAANAPRRGLDRALIFREWGMLLRQSGKPEALRDAIDRFETARRETPHDPLLLHALAHGHVKLGHFTIAVPVLEELVSSKSPETRSRSYELLEQCYDRLDQKLKLAELRDKRAQDERAQIVGRRSKRSVATSSRPWTKPKAERRYPKRRP